MSLSITWLGHATFIRQIAYVGLATRSRATAKGIEVLDIRPGETTD